MNPAAAFAAFVIIVISASPACAYDAMEGAGDFYAGLLLNLLVPAHIMTLAALALLIAQCPRRERYLVFGFFVAGLVTAIAAIASAFATLYAQLYLLAAAALIGFIVASNRRLVFVIAPLAAMAGASLALDSVPQHVSMMASAIALFGTAAGAVLIVAAIAYPMADAKSQWLRIGTRIAGSWIAASAILVLSLNLAR